MEQKVIRQHFEQLQDEICAGIEKLDGNQTFVEDKWERPEGGGGRTRVLEEGKVIEKGGVNFSAVHGPLPEKIADALDIEAAQFFATGISVIMHPVNPWVPIIHMNLRYFRMDSGREWFGGGIDLTPHYISTDQARYFHQTLKKVCDDYHPDYYPEFKKWADEYFYIKHRQESRGIGGIFFDRLEETEDISMKDRFEFVKAVGNTFLPVYRYLVKENQTESYGEAEKQWQYVRRARYVEFNLVYDKGTKFGLDTGGRIESILVSLPPKTGWPYNFQPEEGSEAWETQRMLKKSMDWIKMK
jgi:coproporphyrinogen III oxidase